jgi:hypothetical protein
MFESTARAAIPVALLIAIGASAVGCGSRAKTAAEPAVSSRPSCRDGAADDVEVAARTGGSGVKTGATTAVEGVKTFGKATAGLVEGGTGEAKERWKEGAARTKATAKEGGTETKQEGEVPRCK